VADDIGSLFMGLLIQAHLYWVLAKRLDPISGTELLVGYKNTCILVLNIDSRRAGGALLLAHRVNTVQSRITLPE
jgi:hypothetical protein